jgi:hypothetical protein
VEDSPADRAGALGSFVSLLAAGTGDVRAARGTVLGAPELWIAFWLPDAER